jgi:hypothetical protein
LKLLAKLHDTGQTESSHFENIDFVCRIVTQKIASAGITGVLQQIHFRVQTHTLVDMLWKTLVMANIKVNGFMAESHLNSDVHC